MAKASNVLRMTSLNSGLDTESIVNAMTASTKLKITTNQRKVLKYQAQQEAYQSVISKITTFKNKYFNILGGSSLTSVTNLNKFKSTVSQDGVEKTLSGISVSASSSAKEGSYSVEVLAAASQAKVTSASLNTRQSFDPSDYTSADGEQKYAMSVTVGSATKYITFGGETEDEVIDSINEQLLSFGKTNDGSGIISLQNNSNSTYSFSATDKSAITTSKISTLSDVVELTAGFDNGTNSFTVVIGGESKSISFSTIDSNYFNEIFAKEGEPTDEDGFVFGADETKVALFKQVAQDMYNTQRHELYEEWKDSDYNADAKSVSELSTAQRALFDAEVTRRNSERLTDKYDGAVETAYNAYEKICKKAGMKLSDGLDTENGYLSVGKFKEFLEGKGLTEDNFGSFDFSAIDFSELNRNGAEFSEFGTTVSETFSKAYDDYEAGMITADDYNTFFKVGYNEEEAFNKNYYTEDNATYGGVYISEDDYVSNAVNTVSAAEAAKVFNQNAVKLNLEAITFSDGTKLNVDINYADGNPNEITGFTVTASNKGETVGFDILANSTATDFDVGSAKDTASTVTNSTKLSDLGLTPDDDGNYSFSINGESFSFSGETTVKEMMNTVNSSDAGVKMTFSSLSNKFEIATTKYGADASITLSDGDEGLLSTLGFNGLQTTTAGSNMKLSINGEVVETASNSYEIDGVKFSISSSAAVGTKFDVEVKRDTDALKELIKSFMTDYNQLISDVFGYVDEKPNKDYYFLTDDDKTDMELSDKQEEQWETVAKKGLLYNDSTVIDVMSRFRMSLLGTITGSDGKSFGLPSLGITTSSDYGEHGKLVFYNDSESYLDAALANNYEDIVKLFTDSENGIMQKLSKELDYAVKSTGARTDKGVLVQKAGLATGNSATDNFIYDQIKSLNTLISSLEDRYEKQQDRYWSIYSNLETRMGDLNSQTSYITQMMGM